MASLVKNKHEIRQEDTHPLIKELYDNRQDQVAAMLRATMTGWLKSDPIWAAHTSSVYQRHDKGRKVDFSIFSDLPAKYGMAVNENPFMQLEVDRNTKVHKPYVDIPFAYGIDQCILNVPRLRDMSYPMLYVITILTRQRHCRIYDIVPETATSPLKVFLHGGQCTWKLYFWQNQLIREYNELIKRDTAIYTPVESIEALIDKIDEEEEEAWVEDINADTLA